MAVLNRFSVLPTPNSITSAVLSSSSTATLHAFSKPSAMRIGWMPRSSSASDALKSAPARTGSAQEAESARQQPCQRRSSRPPRAQARGGRTNDAGRAVSNLVVLRLADLHEQLGNLVLDLHLLQDRRAVVGDGDVAVGRDEDLVETWEEQRCGETSVVVGSGRRARRSSEGEPTTGTERGLDDLQDGTPKRAAQRQHASYKEAR